MNEEHDVFNGLGVLIKLKDEDDFLKIKETLTRIGLESRKSKTLYQSCHILHKRGEYAIMHFKEMFEMDGKPSDISDNDIARRNTIARLLEDWGLAEIVDSEHWRETVDFAPMRQIKIIPYKEKSEWNLQPKYSIGKKRGSK